MEKLPQDQRESGISRVIGFTDEQEKGILAYYKRKFEDNELGKNEKEIPPELGEIVGRINEALPDFLRRYGAQALAIPMENIHILDRAQLTPERIEILEKEYEGVKGFHDGQKQSIAFLKEYKEGSKLAFIQTLVHEIMHMEGFYSYQKTAPEHADITLKNGEEDAPLTIRRSGFSIGTMEGQKLLFHFLNESVITELAIRFEHTYFDQWPELAEEIRERDEYIKKVAKRDRVPVEIVAKTVASVKRNDVSDSGKEWVSHSYHHDRKKLGILIDALYRKNPSKFQSREDVFAMFAEATLTGRLLPVARLIEDTFGEGAFRAIGEASGDDR